MASVHPSRMAQVPQDPPPRHADAGRSRRSPSPRRGRSGTRSRSDSPERGRGNNASAPRRASPRYDDFRGRKQSRSRSGERAAPAPNAPWRQAGNMYPPRDGRAREPLPHMQGPPQGFGGDRGSGPRGPPGGNDHYGGGGSAWLDSRRLQRAAMTLSIWPRSPERSRHDDSDDGRHRSSKKRSKRRRSPSNSSDSSDSERERRRRKDKKRTKSNKHDRKRSSRHKRKYSDDDSDRSRSRSPRRRSRSARATSKPKSIREEDEDDWVEKPTGNPLLSTSASGSAAVTTPAAAPSVPDTLEDDDGEEPGPQLPDYKSDNPRAVDERSFGGQLLRGEGSAMAAFLQGEDGTKSRIPRRGEIGLLSEEINAYESVGYVMSGSRHRRMNAVRMRKENQVISAEEKRAVLKLQKEERERREALLREEFKELVEDKLKSATAGPRP